MNNYSLLFWALTVVTVYLGATKSDCKKLDPKPLLTHADLVGLDPIPGQFNAAHILEQEKKLTPDRQYGL